MTGWGGTSPGSSGTAPGGPELMPVKDIHIDLKELKGRFFLHARLAVAIWSEVLLVSECLKRVTFSCKQCIETLYLTNGEDRPDMSR